MIATDIMRAMAPATAIPMMADVVRTDEVGGSVTLTIDSAKNVSSGICEETQENHLRVGEALST
jgi:hypothetical protein